MADGSSGAVELVLCVQNEEHIDGLDDLRVGSVVVVRRAGIHHVEEVFGIAQVFLGRDNGLADSVAITGSSDGWGASEDTVDMLVSLLTGLVDASTDVCGVGLGVEGGHGSHKSGHHSHGMGVVTESLDEWLETIVVGGVLHDLLGEASSLLGGGELTVDEKESGLKEVRLLSELLNGITAVLEDSLLTVDEGNFGDAVNGVHVGGVVGTGDGTFGALDLGQVSGVDGTILDVEFVVFASTVVSDREGVLGEGVSCGIRAELCINER